MNSNTSIEERMDLERVSETELANVLHVCKTIIETIAETKESECDCENCRKRTEDEEKYIKLQNYKKKLGLMSPREEEEFEQKLKLKEINETLKKHLESFYAKMAPHLSNERRLEIESNLNF